MRIRDWWNNLPDGGDVAGRWILLPVLLLVAGWFIIKTAAALDGGAWFDAVVFALVVVAAVFLFKTVKEHRP